MMKTDCVPCTLDRSPQEPNGQHTDRFGRVGMVARWQPVHRGHVPVLRALCDRASQAFIGIGSSNRHNLHNPFTIEETKDMIRLVLADRENYTLIAVPDLDDGPRWRAMIIDLFESLDLFVTDNPYVSSLLAANYKIMKPIALVPQNERIAVNGTMVRRAMAHGGDWQALVPKEIADYIAAKRLDDRFRREFGLQALAMDVITR
jgi:nicotinamide-nucleotide adenylyltransferase